MASTNVKITVTTQSAEARHKIAASHEIRSEFDRLFKARTHVDQRIVGKLLGDYAVRVAEANRGVNNAH